jgi:hypothetical protein
MKGFNGQRNRMPGSGMFIRLPTTHSAERLPPGSGSIAVVGGSSGGASQVNLNINPTTGGLITGHIIRVVQDHAANVASIISMMANTTFITDSIAELVDSTTTIVSALIFVPVFQGIMDEAQNEASIISMVGGTPPFLQENLTELIGNLDSIISMLIYTPFTRNITEEPAGNAAAIISMAV